MVASLVESHFDRKRQVRHYLAVVVAAERGLAGARMSVASERRLIMMRSGVFLILYNLMEAATRGALEAIHDRIARDQVPFPDLNKTLRREVIRLFRTGTGPRFEEPPRELTVAIVVAALGQEIRLGGNVDAKVIRDFGETYGFSTDTPTLRTQKGSDLLTIKSARNDLAHGRKTYEEVGRQYTAGDLLGITRRSLAYISCILGNVDAYLAAEGYREPPAT